MKKLRFDLYSGYVSDKTHTEKDVFIQDDDETNEELIERIIERIFENVDQFINDDGDDDDSEE